jgi:hypothetical protein
MRHVRNTGAVSYFAPQENELPGGRRDTASTAGPAAPALPRTSGLRSVRTATAQSIDHETVRWLAAYPLDPDLVSLMADLRAGEDSDDFVLSDAGLLYLRPDPAEGQSGDALLVPPAGQIRAELLRDAHYEVVEQGDEGGSAHWGPETMLARMGETFWWPGIDDDCRGLVEDCARCMGDGVDGGKARLVGTDMKPGLSPLPFTGMRTDGPMTALDTRAGESAMAADMAFAMRKAEDEARRL